MKTLQTNSVDYFAALAARALSSLKETTISSADLSAQIKVIDGKLGFLEADVVDGNGVVTKAGTLRTYYHEKPYRPKYTAENSVPKTFGWQPEETKAAGAGDAQPVYEMGDLAHTTLSDPPEGTTDAPIQGNKYVEFDVRHGVTKFNRIFVGYLQQEGEPGNNAASECPTLFLGNRWRQGYGARAQSDIIICTGLSKPWAGYDTHGFIFHGFEFTLRS